MRSAEAAASSYFYHHNRGNVMSKSKQPGWSISFFLGVSPSQHYCHFWWDNSLWHRKMFSSIPDLNPLDASSTAPWQSQISPDIAKYPPGRKSAPDWGPLFYKYLRDTPKFPSFCLRPSWTGLWFLSSGRASSCFPHFNETRAAALAVQGHVKPASQSGVPGRIAPFWTDYWCLLEVESKYQ